jgi:nucleoside-diphosphate-sugar epimerase
VRVCVTGASGKAGRAVVADLLMHGHDVRATDLLAPGEDIGARLVQADLTDYGQAIDVIGDAESVVHLANIPAPQLRPPVDTFNTNTTMNFNVFFAATRLGLGRVVWASSETTLGLPFDVRAEALLARRPMIFRRRPSLIRTGEIATRR